MSTLPKHAVTAPVEGKSGLSRETINLATPTQYAHAAAQALLTTAPIDVAGHLEALAKQAPGLGALVSFQGMVRPLTKQGEAVERLFLDYHPRMTLGSLRQIAQDGLDRFDLGAVTVVHRCGAMQPGDIIVLVAVASDHRRDAFLAGEYLMDRLKTEAVFWKREIGAFGERWIEPTEQDNKERKRWNEESTGN